ncbi:HAD-IA family hydrolase [Virgibacillus sp. C22-A2]|uniref:HAD-IA family hydrolase n=1 Tax=Virgibacillus tibetensis TaxID=3042313 RepID=A0ABU6KLA9_9BACI|nr:HAD-IA family hydrolase [Virgibacillus sp. C22-A2]
MNILWDFDGTLINTYPAYTRLFTQVLEETTDPDEIYKHLKKSFSHAMQYYKLTEHQVEELRFLESKIEQRDVKPFPGVEKVLKFASKNVIMTHKDREGVDSILKYYGMTHYFTDIVSIDDGFPRKPDASAYRYLHRKYTIDLVIGDRELDILPAKELGIKTCLFQNKKAVADFYIDNYTTFFEEVTL